MIPASESIVRNETRIVLAMRWELVRRGIVGMLHEVCEAGFGIHPSVVGEASDAEELFELTQACEPDVIICRGNFMGLGVHEFMNRLSHARGASTPVIVLARMMDPDRIVQAWGAGVRGYLRSEIDLGTMAAALHAVRSGNMILCPEAERLVEKLISQCIRPLPDVSGLVESLTIREREVMELVAEGLSNKEIAFRMNIGRRTAEMHVARLIDKFGMASRSELLVALLKN